MANTYELIKGETLASAQSSYTFSAIPSTYTDLCLKMSIRDSQAATDTAYNITINGSSTASSTHLYAAGSTGSVGSSRQTATVIDLNRMSGASATSNTFGSIELYIPSYAANQNKQFSNFGNAESNDSAVQMGFDASLWSNTAAITSIAITSSYATNLAAGSSFYLYGIKNS